MAQQDAALRIVASVYGQESVSQLQTTLDTLVESTLKYSDAKKLMTAQTAVEIQQLKMSNGMLKARANMNQGQMTQLAKQTVLEQQYQQQFNVRFQAEQNAYSLREMYKNEGIKITKKEAMAANEANAQIIAGEQAKATAMANTRKAMMAASISMFVLNISIGQMISSLKPLVKNNEAATEALTNLQGAFALAMAPMQAFMAIQMIMTVTSMSLAQAIQMIGGSLLFAIGLMGAMTTKSTEMRLAYSALAGVAGVLAAAQFLSSVATFANAGAFATLQAVMGSPMGLLALGLGLAATTFAIGTVLSNKQKAQTLTGHRKRVRKGGLAELDDDEVVQRVSKDGTKSGGGGDTIIMLPESYNGSMADAKITAHTVKRMQNGGYGSVKYTRKVVAGG